MASTSNVLVSSLAGWLHRMDKSPSFTSLDLHTSRLFIHSFHSSSTQGIPFQSSIGLNFPHFALVSLVVM